MPPLVAVLGLAISGTQLAQEIWAVVKPILAEGRDPSEAEWAALDAMADRAHAEMQQAGDASAPGAPPDA